MATRIRLRRVGRKKQPSYRIVVADAATPRDGRYVALVGWYNPRAKRASEVLKVEVEQAKAWLAKGATPTDTVRSLLRKAGVFRRN
jgi:small subunit ribosomal protein S16